MILWLLKLKYIRVYVVGSTVSTTYINIEKRCHIACAHTWWRGTDVLYFIQYSSHIFDLTYGCLFC